MYNSYLIKRWMKAQKNHAEECTFNAGLCCLSDMQHASGPFVSAFAFSSIDVALSRPKCCAVTLSKFLLTVVLVYMEWNFALKTFGSSFTLATG